MDRIRGLLQHRALLVFAMGHFTVDMFGGLMPVLYAIMADEFDLSNADIGLIAQRYTMDLMGDHQEIQIRSWTSQLDRFSKTVPFAWEGGQWYTMKFRAAMENGKAVLKGKVWKRGEKEPAAWTIEAVDEAPNMHGSPGLFGNAQTSEILVDNISVTPNQAGG